MKTKREAELKSTEQLEVSILKEEKQSLIIHNKDFKEKPYWIKAKIVIRLIRLTINLKLGTFKNV